MSEHPQWIIKFIHKSKINAVKIVNWEDHSEIATVPYVYQFNGEESDGSKAARLIASAPELLEALKQIDAYYSDELGATYLDENHPQNIARRWIDYVMNK